MPSTVIELLKAAGLTPQGVVPWGSPVPVNSPGNYIVSISQDPHLGSPCLEECPIDRNALREWLKVCRKLTLDGRPATMAALTDRLSRFWLADETILYIGKATSLRGRVGAYYRTPIGAAGPHSGGYLSKTLADLRRLFVHFAAARDAERCEAIMIERFSQTVSASSRKALFDPGCPLPFANLASPGGARKRHGIRGARTRSPRGSLETAASPPVASSKKLNR